MLGKSPHIYQSVGVILFKYSSLMGVLPSIASLPGTKIATMSMIYSTTSSMSKAKEIVEAHSMLPHESLYRTTQSTSDAYIHDQHLVA